MDRRSMIKATALGGMATIGPALAPAAAAAPPRGRIAPARIAARDGTSLYSRSWGSGPAIVFLAGWSLPSEIWSCQMAPLSERGFRCIAYDRRGHGRSDDPGTGYDYDTLADDLERVLIAHDVRGATIVAHSASGGEVVRLASRGRLRGRVSRVVFLATTLPFLTRSADNPAGLPAGFFQTLRSRFYSDYPGWIEENADPFVVPATSPLMRTWIKSLMLRTSLRAVIDFNRAMTETDFRRELRSFPVPALFLHGDKDASSPLEISGRPASNITPGATLQVVKGAPHGLFVTHADQVNDAIGNFAGR